MKKVIWTAVFILMGIGVYYSLLSNPIIVPWFSELAFTANGWVLELNGLSGAEMNGWYLVSRQDTAYFKPTVILTKEYPIITQDSLLTSLRINPDGDSLSLVDNYGDKHTLVVFGTSPNAAIIAPKAGQSICYDMIYQGDFFYLDNTPTLGQRNDTVNATCNIVGWVHDNKGMPIQNVIVSYMTAGYHYVTTDIAGYFTISSIACKQDIFFEESSYSSKDTILQLWPDSTITVNVTMLKGSSVERIRSQSIPKDFSISEPYPNPFNPEMQIQYSIPRNGNVQIEIFDIGGKLVNKIFSGSQSAGKYQVHWNAARFPSGVYIIRIQASEVMLSKKCALVK